MNDKALSGLENRIKEIRRKFGKSQKEMAKVLGISPNYLSEIENGKSKPGFEFVKSIVLKCNVDAMYLLCGSGEMFRETEPELAARKKDYGEYSDTIHEMLDHMQGSASLKMAILEFFKRYSFENKELIEYEMKKMAIII